MRVRIYYRIVYLCLLSSLFFATPSAQVRIKEKIVIQPNTTFRNTSAVSNIRFVFRTSFAEAFVRLMIERPGDGDYYPDQFFFGYGSAEASYDNAVEGVYSFKAGLRVSDYPCPNPNFPTDNYVDIYVNGILVKTVQGDSHCCTDGDDCSVHMYFDVRTTGQFSTDGSLDHFAVTPFPSIIKHYNPFLGTASIIKSGKVPKDAEARQLLAFTDYDQLSVIFIEPMDRFNFPVTLDPSTVFTFTLDNEGAQLGSYRGPEDASGFPQSGPTVTATLAEVKQSRVIYVADKPQIKGNAVINVSGSGKTGNAIIKVVEGPCDLLQVCSGDPPPVNYKVQTQRNNFEWQNERLKDDGTVKFTAQKVTVCQGLVMGFLTDGNSMPVPYSYDGQRKKTEGDWDYSWAALPCKDASSDNVQFKIVNPLITDESISIKLDFVADICPANIANGITLLQRSNDGIFFDIIPRDGTPPSALLGGDECAMLRDLCQSLHTVDGLVSTEKYKFKELIDEHERQHQLQYEEELKKSRKSFFDDPLREYRMGCDSYNNYYEQEGAGGPPSHARIDMSNIISGFISKAEEECDRNSGVYVPHNETAEQKLARLDKWKNNEKLIQESQGIREIVRTLGRVVLGHPDARICLDPLNGISGECKNLFGRTQ